MWEIYLRNPDPEDNEGLTLIVPNIIPDWRPPEVGDTWGPFEVVEVDPLAGTVDIEVRKDLLTDIP